jgi:hypothetical protein
MRPPRFAGPSTKSSWIDSTIQPGNGVARSLYHQPEAPQRCASSKRGDQR